MSCDPARPTCAGAAAAGGDRGAVGRDRRHGPYAARPDAGAVSPSLCPPARRGRAGVDAICCPIASATRVLSGLPTLERPLLCAVCCSCSTLSHAARELGLTDDEAAGSGAGSRCSPLRWQDPDAPSTSADQRRPVRGRPHQVFPSPRAGFQSRQRRRRGHGRRRRAARAAFDEAVEKAAADDRGSGHRGRPHRGDPRDRRANPERREGEPADDDAKADRPTADPTGAVPGSARTRADRVAGSSLPVRMRCYASCPGRSAARWNVNTSASGALWRRRGRAGTPNGRRAGMRWRTRPATSSKASGEDARHKGPGVHSHIADLSTSSPVRPEQLGEVTPVLRNRVDDQSPGRPRGPERVVADPDAHQETPRVDAALGREAHQAAARRSPSATVTMYIG